MWKLQRIADRQLVVLKLSGHIEAEGLPELREVLESEANAEKLVLDLSGLSLAGQEAVKFFAAWEGRDTELRNCPDYIRDWITRERNKAQAES